MRVLYPEPRTRPYEIRIYFHRSALRAHILGCVSKHLLSKLFHNITKLFGKNLNTVYLEFFSKFFEKIPNKFGHFSKCLEIFWNKFGNIS